MTTLAKVGGSLFDLPDLGRRLQRWRATIAGPVWLVPGGGRLADVVRQLQPIHSLDDAAAHWTAIRTMTVNAHWLSALTQWPVCAAPTAAPTAWLDVVPFCLADATLAHSWDVTSDSIAVHMAHGWHADFALLKSTTCTARSWTEAAHQGLVDRAFPTFVGERPVQWVNLRADEWR